MVGREGVYIRTVGFRVVGLGEVEGKGFLE